MLFKKPPQLDIGDNDRAYLKCIGIDIQDGQASESGLSGVFNDVEGVAPIGAATGTSSSTPPNFLCEPATSYVPPFIAEPAAPVGTELQVVPEFSVPDTTKSTDFPILPPPAFETPSVSATESPPPREDSWNGPALNIPATPTVLPPPVEPLQSRYSPIMNTQPQIGEKVTHLPTVEKNVRRIIPDAPTQNSFSVPLSPANNISSDVPPNPISQYAKTAVRQAVTFEPVRPESPPNAPIVAFAPPKRANQILQSEPPQQVEIAPQPFNASPVTQNEDSHLSIESPAMSIGTQEVPNTQDSVEQYILSQQALVDSGEPESMRQAYIHLSQLYEHNRLGDRERALMYPILDRLALKVVYAKDTHILEPPYRVKPGDTIESIASEFNLTSVLLRKINSLPPSVELPPGAMLKVLYGQFDAKISVKRREITLLLGGLYAGRFAFAMPNPGVPLRSGELYVTNRVDRMMVLSNGWILSTAQTKNATIVFSDRDAQEIFDILSDQSVIMLE